MEDFLEHFALCVVNRRFSHGGGLLVGIIVRKFYAVVRIQICVIEPIVGSKHTVLLSLCWLWEVSIEAHFS